jgi:hypothetical protein
MDPGVGSKRRALLIESEQSYFIGPDNGIFSLVLGDRPIQQIVELSNPAYHLKPASATFHGRDIFAPAAAYLSLGISANELGAQAQDFTRLPWPRISKREASIKGEVIYIDGFGNVITNIREDDLPANRSGLTVSLRGIAVRGLVPSYAWGREGEYVALINSSSLLEIALSKGNAQAASGAEIGDKVSVQELSKAL